MPLSVVIWVFTISSVFSVHLQRNVEVDVSYELYKGFFLIKIKTKAKKIELFLMPLFCETDAVARACFYFY